MPGLKGTMREYENKELHSGSKTGPIVKSKKQAIAIGLSEQRKESSKATKHGKGHSFKGRRKG